MGLLDAFKGKSDDIKAAVGGGGVAAGSEEESAVSGVLGDGGISGLMGKFDAGGLGDKMKSWIGKGENAPVSVGEIKSVLGSDQISAVAAKLGISSDEAASKIASVLPTVIDKLTPDGLVPDPGAIADKLAGFLKK